MDKHVVITINREYGSGGRTVGEMLANDLGIAYYDKDILKLAADESGISEELFIKFDEGTKQKQRNLFRVAGKVYNGELLTPESRDFTSEQNLFNYQAKVIRELAESESCVIVGRCADFILRDLDYVVSVFVHAPKPFLLQEAAKKKSLTGRELEKYVDMVNRNRSDFHMRYTGLRWDDAHGYDLCLNSGRLGFDRCVEAIKAYLKVRVGEE